MTESPIQNVAALIECNVQPYAQGDATGQKDSMMKLARLVLPLSLFFLTACFPAKYIQYTHSERQAEAYCKLDGYFLLQGFGTIERAGRCDDVLLQAGFQRSGSQPPATP